MESTDNLKCDLCGGTASWRPDKFARIDGADCGDLNCFGKLRASVLPEMVLPSGSSERKNIPLTTGLLDYFPLALAGVARISKKGNDKHNPGQPLHWSRDKSQDHADCIPRHLVDRDAPDPDTTEPHYLSMCWRALAYAQIMEEKRLGKPISRGSQ